MDGSFQPGSDDPPSLRETVAPRGNEAGRRRPGFAVGPGLGLAWNDARQPELGSGERVSFLRRSLLATCSNGSLAFHLSSAKPDPMEGDEDGAGTGLFESYDFTGCLVRRLQRD